MTTTIQKIESHEMELTRDQIELIKKTVAKGATDDELNLFLHVARKCGLDPLTKQVHFVKRGNIGTFQTGIDGLRVIAERSGEYLGQTIPVWCGKDGVWHDVWTGSEPPVAAKVGVYRKGFAEPIYGIARYEAYVQRTGDGKPYAIWAKMPDLMTAKCAEALAIRKAFPQDLSGLYTFEEMQQADSEYLPEPQVEKQVKITMPKHTAPKPEKEQPVDFLETETPKSAFSLTTAMKQIESVNTIEELEKSFKVLIESFPKGSAEYKSFISAVKNRKIQIQQETEV